MPGPILSPTELKNGMVEDWPSKGFRSRCVTRLETVMSQNPLNTLVKQFEGDAWRAEQYYFDKANNMPNNNRGHYMREITRALKHFKGPGPAFCPLPEAALTIPQPIPPVLVSTMQLRSSNDDHQFPSQAFRDNNTQNLKTLMTNEQEKVHKLGIPVDPEQIEHLVFLFSEGNKDSYNKMMGQLKTTLASDVTILPQPRPKIEATN